MLYSVTGLSSALNQLCSIANGHHNGVATNGISSVGLPVNRSLLNWSLPPAQSLKIDKITQQMMHQEKFWEVYCTYYFFLNSVSS